jgi:hypothetical protein
MRGSAARAALAVATAVLVAGIATAETDTAAGAGDSPAAAFGSRATVLGSPATGASAAPTPATPATGAAPSAGEPAPAEGAAPAAAEPAAVPDTRAAEHVGREVTIEGRVYAIHVSPLATVLSFAPNFSGFTATILAADRERFPTDVAERARDNRARVTGVVTAYRGRPEMTLRDPTQLVVIPSIDATPAPDPRRAAAAPTPDAAAEETRRIVLELAARLRLLEARVAALESLADAPPVEEPLGFGAEGLAEESLNLR